MRKFTFEELITQRFILKYKSLLFDQSETKNEMIDVEKIVECCITNISRDKLYVQIEGVDEKFNIWIEFIELQSKVLSLVGGLSDLSKSILYHFKSLHLQQTEQWSKDFGAYINDNIGFPEKPIRDLRIQLLEEECSELCDAIMNCDFIKAVDGCADLQVVLDGTVLALGIHGKMNEISTEIYLSNDSKKDENGNVILSETGKILKSNLFQKPEIQKILDGVETDLHKKARLKES